MQTLSWPLVSLRGVAQLAFADRAYAGGLVLCAIALVSPWAAIGALSGALFGALIGAKLALYAKWEWDIGLSCFNTSIIGLVWGNFFASGEWNLAGLFVTLALCVALEWGLRRLLGRWDLPTFSMPAVLALCLVALTYQLADQPFWQPFPPPPFGAAGLALAVLCVIGAMASQSVVATAQAVSLSAAATLLFSAILGVDVMALSGLWALTVAPASFGLHGVFLVGSLTGALAGLVAALVATLIWSAWTFSGLALLIPPMVTPFIIGSWLTLVLLRRGTLPRL